MIKGSGNFMAGNSTLYILFLPKLITIDTVLWTYNFLVFHVILQDHVIIPSCEFMGRSQSRYVIILPRFVTIGIVILEICF